MNRLLLCALAGATLLPCPVFAGVLLPAEPGAQPLQLRRQSVQIDVKDQVARATLDEVFENLSDKPVEGSYRLQLPEGAAVSGFATWIDGKKVESRIEEKHDAQATYDAAKARREQPALMEKSEENVFTTRIDGIPAHGTRRVEAAFAQILPYDGGLVTLRLPLAISSSCGPEPVGDFKVSVNVADQKKITELKVLTHQAVISRVGPGAFTVSIAAKNVAAGAKELVLTYRTESSTLGLSFVPFKPEGEKEGYFLLLASPQELTTAEDIVQKDVIFVFDTSGSMQSEDKIGQARQALKRCLSNLNPKDRFGVVAFSDSTNPFKNKLIDASPANVREAQEFADGLNAMGGTNISGALLKGLEMVAGSERPHVLVFMTDGIPSAGISDPHNLAVAVKEKNTTGARLFSFGVGSDVNRTLLEQLSRENRGSHDFVERGQSIDQVVGTFYAKISRPVLSDLAFDFGDVTTTMQYPDVLPDLYKGSQLVVVGRYRGAGKVQGHLTGMLNGKKHAIPFSAEFPSQDASNPFVARLWAQRRIDYLMSQERLAGIREESKSEIIALSTQYQIITSYTSMVAVRPQDNRGAAVYPARVRPGDPVLSIRAPRDARKVKVTLPFGEEKLARWDDELECWTVRFLVPVGTADGSYPIKVEITHADQRHEELAVELAIDTSAPSMVARIDAVSAGHTFRIHTVAVVSASELAAAALLRADRYEAVKQLFDVRRVTARLWDGREVELALDDGGFGFTASAETNTSLKRGTYPVLLTAQDYAGNSSQLLTSVEIR